MVTEYLTAGINVQLLRVLPNMKDALYLIPIKTGILDDKDKCPDMPGYPELDGLSLSGS
jgi:hypothetical protein